MLNTLDASFANSFVEHKGISLMPYLHLAQQDRKRDRLERPGIPSLLCCLD